MNLREEIRYYLRSYYDCVSYDDAVNEIIRLIEKRIDSKIIELHKEWKEPPKVAAVPWNDMYATIISTILELRAELLKQ